MLNRPPCEQFLLQLTPKLKTCLIDPHLIRVVTGCFILGFPRTFWFPGQEEDFWQGHFFIQDIDQAGSWSAGGRKASWRNILRLPTIFSDLAWHMSEPRFPKCRTDRSHPNPASDVIFTFLAVHIQRHGTWLTLSILYQNQSNFVYVSVQFGQKYNVCYGCEREC